ncbi:MAG TPA: chlorohydrolase family protein [Chloroflexota bacterium]|jgi:5-methylthioadenosine/S-adenosylhomocysteine deaminase|nr:chlorohydrolase family protein [Chloroflexota bacterium]
MRTLIQGGWVVGFRDGHHELLREGVVVYEGNEILHVGHRFDGRVDRTIDARGRLVSPGFINCHLHAGTNANHLFLIDHTKTDYFGSNFIAYAAGKRGTLDPRGGARVEVEQKYGLWAAMRGGATTIMDVGTRNAEAFLEMVGQLGVRIYMGPGFRSYEYVYDDQGRVQWDPAPPGADLAGLERAVKFAREHDGAHNGRVRCMLFPGQLDTCTIELLQATRRAANETGLRLSLHVAMNLVEFHRILREYRRTPIQLVHDIGFLGPDVILGHCVFHNRHSWVHYPYGDDLQLLADSGASVAHAPYKYAKMGILFESLWRYRERGINVALGTDTFPEDLIHEMRIAGAMCRFAEGSYLVGLPHEVFDCATLGGAKFLGRDDLGRLAPGAKADILIINLTGPRFGAVRDPIKSLIDAGTSDDIETIIIDGQAVLENRVPRVVDEAALLAQIQESGERIWASVPQWHWRGARADEVVPMSYPVREPA